MGPTRRGEGFAQRGERHSAPCSPTNTDAGNQSVDQGQAGATAVQGPNILRVPRACYCAVLSNQMLTSACSAGKPAGTASVATAPASPQKLASKTLSHPTLHRVKISSLRKKVRLL